MGTLGGGGDGATGASAGGATGTTENSGGASGAGASSGGAPGGAGGQGASGGNSSAGGNLGTGDKSTGATSWRDTLPDDIKNDPTLNKYSDLPNLAKAHIELQRKIGEKGIFKPKEGASADEIKAFREALGIPTDPSKYELSFDDKSGVSPEVLAWAKDQGAKRGIDPSEMKGFMEDYMKLEQTHKGVLAAASQEDTKKGLQDLKTEWGETYDRNIQRANFAAEKLGGKPLVERLVKFGAHNDPLILKAFADAAKLYGEDRLREGGVGDSRMTPGELDSKISLTQSRMMAAKSGTAEHKALVEEYSSLWRQKTGGR